MAGRIVTFYSYKGGTGRSMALANVAWILASNGKKVLVLDWDLEAPGLHRYLTPFLRDKDLTASDGLIDFVIKFATAAATPPQETAGEAHADKDWFLPYANILRYATSIQWEFERGGTIDFIPAGRQGPSYSTRVNSFNWQFFYDRIGGGALLEQAKKRMRDEYDYILIDSRTGVSDTSGICTVQMPDDLVICFTLNNQSIEGAATVARSVYEQRTSVKKPIDIFPIAMRVENGEKSKLEARQVLAREKFWAFPNRLSSEERERYWGEVQVLYIPYYAYEEILACFGDNVTDRFSVLAACEQITSYLTRHEVTRLVPPSEEDRSQILRVYGESQIFDKLREQEQFAEEVLSRFSPKEQDLVRQAFMRLVLVSGSGELGSSNLRWVRLGEIEEPVARIIQPLVSAGLLVQEDDRIRISDSDLIEGWPWFRKWIEKEQAFIVWRQSLQDKISDWLREGKKRRFLLSGAWLKDASHWLLDYGDRLNSLEQLYLRQSLAGADKYAQQIRLAAALAALTVITLLIAALITKRFGDEGRSVSESSSSRSVPAPSSKESCTGGLLGRPLRVGIVTWPGFAGGIVANNGFEPTKDSIYYRQHSLCVELILIEDVDARAKAFMQGGKDGVDIVWSSVDFWAYELPVFLKSDVKAQAIMQVDWSQGGDAIVADKSIRRIEDLYQKKISLALFTPSHWLLEYSLQNSAVDDAQQSEIMRGLVGEKASPDARADFVDNKVDAAVLWEPDVAGALANRPNSHILVSTSEARKLIADVMVAREAFIRDHPDVIRAFIEGWIIDGTAAVNREPGTVVKLLMENEPLYKELGSESTSKNLTTVKLADMADNTEMFNLDGRDEQPLFDRLFNKTAKSWLARGYITASVAPALARDDSFLREIYKAHPFERTPDIFSPAPSMETKLPLTISIYVNLGSELDAASQKAIDEQFGFLKISSMAYIRVEGNTDNLGNPAANRALSQRRAQLVVDYLVSKYHLSRSQFIVVGNGSNKPIAPNDSAEGRARNRRIDISIALR